MQLYDEMLSVLNVMEYGTVSESSSRSYNFKPVGNNRTLITKYAKYSDQSFSQQKRQKKNSKTVLFIVYSSNIRLAK